MSRNNDRLETIISKTVRIKGDIATDSGLRLDGQIEGKVEVGSILITGKDSLIKGDVHCKEAIIAGRIEGNVFATDAIEMQTGASIFGDIHCKQLIIQKDCFFEGKCQMVERKEELVTVWAEPRKIEKASSFYFYCYYYFEFSLGNAAQSLSTKRCTHL